ncbi:hypothetical protein PENTCL1PPCAC_11674, partial [Pristionchus entomophagus]
PLLSSPLTIMNSSSSSLLCSASTSTDLELFIEFAIAIPSMILYALFFIVYFKSFQLRSSYYLLFFVHSCINMVYFLSRALLMRVPSFSLLCQWFLDHFGHFQYTFTPLYFLYHYTQQAQALSIIAININRVMAIYFYNSFTLLHYTTHLLLFSLLLLPLPLTWHLLISPVKFIPSPPMIAMDYARIVSYPGLSVSPSHSGHSSDRSGGRHFPSDSGTDEVPSEEEEDERAISHHRLSSSLLRSSPISYRPVSHPFPPSSILWLLLHSQSSMDHHRLRLSLSPLVSSPSLFRRSH